MANTLGELRAKFGANKPPPKPRPEVAKALSLLKKGRCPVCANATFSRLICKSCGFSVTDTANIELDQGTLTLIQKGAEPPEDEDLIMARIAIQAADWQARGLDIQDGEAQGGTESSADHLKKLEEDIERQQAIKARVRTVRQQVGGGLSEGGRFTIETAVDGGQRDAILQFGNYKGQRVSEMMLQPESARYLHWILGEKFNTTLKDIIREQMGLPKAGDE